MEVESLPCLSHIGPNPKLHKGEEYIVILLQSVLPACLPQYHMPLLIHFT